MKISAVATAMAVTIAISGCGEEASPVATDSSPVTSGSAPPEQESSADSCDPIVSLGTTLAVIVGRPKFDSPSRTSELVTMLPVLVESVVWTNPGTSVKVGSVIDLAVYPDPDRKVGESTAFDGTGIETLWPDRDGASGTFLLAPAYQGDAPFSVAFVASPVEKSERVELLPNEPCSDSKALDEVAKRAGRTFDLSFLLDYLTEVRAYYEYGTVGDLLSPPSDDTSPDSSPSRDELWYNTDPTQRSIDFKEIPAELADKLFLLGVDLATIGELEAGVLIFRCELGVGLQVVQGSEFPMLVVPTCKEGSLEIVLETDAGKQSTLGYVDDPYRFAEDGALITITADGEKSSVNAASLNDGDLERLLGVDSEQLEELRKEYSTPTSMPADG